MPRVVLTDEEGRTLDDWYTCTNRECLRDVVMSMIPYDYRINYGMLEGSSRRRFAHNGSLVGQYRNGNPGLLCVLWEMDPPAHPRYCVMCASCGRFAITGTDCQCSQCNHVDTEDNE